MRLATFATALAIGLILVVIVDLLGRRHDKDIVIVTDVAILALLVAESHRVVPMAGTRPADPVAEVNAPSDLARPGLSRQPPTPSAVSRTKTSVVTATRPWHATRITGK